MYEHLGAVHGGALRRAPRHALRRARLPESFTLRAIGCATVLQNHGWEARPRGARTVHRKDLLLGLERQALRPQGGSALGPVADRKRYGRPLWVRELAAVLRNSWRMAAGGASAQ